MPAELLQSYVESLRSSVNIFPVQKEKLENAFGAKDYAQTLYWLKAIRNGLSRIHADNFVKDCEKQLEQNHDIGNIRPERLKSFIDYFLSNLIVFFTDIQQFLDALEVARSKLEQKDKPKSQKLKEKLFAITELDSEKIEPMTDEQLNRYVKELKAFVEDFPTYESGLSGSLKMKHYMPVLRRLSAIKESLLLIHADSLAEDCQNQIELNRDIKNIRHEKLVIFVNYFLRSLSMLYDDIKALDLR